MKLLAPLLIIVGLVVVIIFGVKFVSAKTNTEQINPFISSSGVKKVTTPTPSPKEQEVVTQKIPVANSAVDDIFKKYSEEYAEIELSLEIIDLTANKKYQHNADRENIGASTTKLFTASAFLSELEKGKYTFDQKLGSYDTKFQLQQLVKQSNNISWELFLDLVGRKNIESYTHAIGSKDFNISKNSLTASDMANYLQKLAKRELHSEENTTLMLSHMQDTYDETFIPSQVPGFELHHKNGQLEQVVNEAIIAVGEKKTIVLAIYTDGKDKWEYTKRRELIKGITTDTLTALK